MAGVKGRSGGRRPGAGRKPKAGVVVAPDASSASVPAAGVTFTGDAKAFLETVVRGDVLPTPAQLDAAKALLPYQHKKLGESGKKEQKQDEAGKVAGRFAQAAAPRLIAADGKRV